jgi:hypothetical protein
MLRRSLSLSLFSALYFQPRSDKDHLDESLSFTTVLSTIHPELDPLGIAVVRDVI